MVGGTWWAVSGGWYMVGSECFVFANVILVNNVVVVVVVVYVVNDGCGHK